MSNKVLDVMREMLSKPHRIQETFMSGGELFFRYNGYLFSILRSQSRDPEFGPYSFYVYPKWTGMLPELARQSESDPENLPMVSYDSGQFDTDEEKGIFRDLYALVLNKHLNVDMIFDQILGAK